MHHLLEGKDWVGDGVGGATLDDTIGHWCILELVHDVGSCELGQDPLDGGCVMHMIVQIFFVSGLHDWTELVALVVLRCHLNIGKDCESNLWLCDGDTVGGHLCGLCLEELGTCADLFLEVEYKVDNLNKLVEDVYHRWHVCAGDGGLDYAMEPLLLHTLVVFALKRAEDATGDAAAN